MTKLLKINLNLNYYDLLGIQSEVYIDYFNYVYNAIKLKTL